MFVMIWCYMNKIELNIVASTLNSHLFFLFVLSDGWTKHSHKSLFALLHAKCPTKPHSPKCQLHYRVVVMNPEIQRVLQVSKLYQVLCFTVVSDKEPPRSQGDRENPVTWHELEWAFLLLCLTWESETGDYREKSLKIQRSSFQSECFNRSCPRVTSPFLSLFSPFMTPPFSLHHLFTWWKMLMKSKDRSWTDFKDSGKTVYLSQVLPPLPNYNKAVCCLESFLSHGQLTWKHLGAFSPVLFPFSCRRGPHFVLPEKVTQFLWHTATAHHKSVHLTMGPQIYQPMCFESGGYIVTRKGGEVAHRCHCAETYGRCSPTLQSRKRCPMPGPQPDFTAFSRETRRYKGPGSTSVSRAKLLGNKSFWGFMKKEKGDGGWYDMCCPDPPKSEKQRYVK